MSGGEGSRDPRQVLRRKLERRSDLSTANRVDIIEATLGYFMEGGGLRELAYRISQRYGDISQASKAPVNELAELMGAEAAADLKLLFRLTANSRSQNSLDLSVTDIEGLERTVLSCFMGSENESYVVLPVSPESKVVAVERLDVGGDDTTKLEPQAVIEKMLMYQCRHCFLAHCHLSGDPQPSLEDIRQTRILLNMMKMMELRLLDHFITAGGTIFSMRRSGHLSTLDL